MTEIVRREELQAVIEARAELGADMEPAVIDAFVERLERRLAEGAAEREQASKSSPVSPASSWSVGALAVIAYVSTR